MTDKIILIALVLLGQIFGTGTEGADSSSSAGPSSSVAVSPSPASTRKIFDVFFNGEEINQETDPADKSTEGGDQGTKQLDSKEENLLKYINEELKKSKDKNSLLSSLKKSQTANEDPEKISKLDEEVAEIENKIKLLKKIKDRLEKIETAKKGEMDNIKSDIHDEMVRAIEGAQNSIYIQSSELITGKVLYALFERLVKATYKPGSEKFKLCILINNGHKRSSDQPEKILDRLETEFPNIFHSINFVYIKCRNDDHNKVLIIDPDTEERILITGSANFTSNSSKCDENAIKTNDKFLIKQYSDNWNTCLDSGIRITGAVINVSPDDQNPGPETLPEIGKTRALGLIHIPVTDAPETSPKIEVFFQYSTKVKPVEGESAERKKAEEQSDTDLSEIIINKLNTIKSADNPGSLIMEFYSLTDEQVINKISELSETMRITIVVNTPTDKLESLLTKKNIEIKMRVFNKSNYAKTKYRYMHNKIILALDKEGEPKWVLSGSYNPSNKDKWCENLMYIPAADDECTTVLDKYKKDAERVIGHSKVVDDAMLLEIRQEKERKQDQRRVVKDNADENSDIPSTYGVAAAAAADEDNPESPSVDEEP